MAQHEFELHGISVPRFTQEQIRQIVEEAEQLQIFVEKHEISPLERGREDAEEIFAKSPHRVFSLRNDPAFFGDYRASFGIWQCLDLEADQFFIGSTLSKIPSPFPYTILEFSCSACEELGDCFSCEDGDLPVKFFWDSDWRVWAEYVGPDPD